MPSNYGNSNTPFYLGNFKNQRNLAGMFHITNKNIHFLALGQKLLIVQMNFLLTLSVKGSFHLVESKSNGHLLCYNDKSYRMQHACPYTGRQCIGVEGASDIFNAAF